MFTRLNKLGICLSHSRTIKIIKEFGDHYDSEVLFWKSALSQLPDILEDENESDLETEEETTDTEEEILSPLSSGMIIIITLLYIPT